ncbi:hypothetical protein EXS57_00060 [Candidatus Kaiserbacteria bacterium]|nr:hypothetical protein [Candidatus Kaiserbacteria bacterium]
MFRILGVVSTSAALFLSAGIALAEEGTTVSTVPSVEAVLENPVPAAIRAETERAARERAKNPASMTRVEAEKFAKERMEAAREEAKAKTDTIRAEVKAGTTAVREEMKAKAEAIRAETKTDTTMTREEVKAKIEALREESKVRIEAAREEAKVRLETIREESKERMKLEREKVTQRVTEIKDKKRQQTAEKLASKFENLNKAWTDRFTARLDRLNAVVLKMETRVATAVTNGKDVTAVTASIQTAKNLIATAQTEVTTQAGKSYTPDTSTITATAETAATTEGQEELVKALKTAFQTLHTTLFKDLFALRDGSMTTARKAVQDALVVLGKVPGVDEETATTAAPTTVNQ